MTYSLLLHITTPPENLFLAEVTFSGYIFGIFMGRDKIQTIIDAKKEILKLD